ncbi:MAG TPA: OmpH family outer membrane protein [Caulobacteraceae bacterium]|nr:OmpH family outer membrane protein [Caulobacteraceae bacterium]
MTKNTGAAFASVLALAAFAPMLAQAQAQGTTPSAAPPTGPAIPGMCVLSQEAIVFSSTVGKYVTSRLQQLNQAASAEVSADATSLQNDEKAFDASRAGLSPEQLQQRGAALQGRENDLSRTVQIRREEMTQTQQNADKRILAEASPIFEAAVHAHNCSIVVSGTGVLVAETSMDLTPTVIAGLNAKITQFAFDRVHLDQTAAAPSGQ